MSNDYSLAKEYNSTLSKERDYEPIEQEYHCEDANILAINNKYKQLIF